MRCGGCGAKVGSAVLGNVLRRLKPFARDDVPTGLNAPDDAAIIVVPPGKVAVHTVDFFRAFIGDPYLFGRVAANHCLGDIFAMGAEPQSALAIVTAPFGAAARVEEQLFQVMSGAAEVLAEHQTTFAGGHTAEGPELAFGLSVQGFADADRLLRKGGMKAGERLILTKPLGTGALFAAEMRGRAKGAWIDAAIQSMVRSSRAAAQCLQRHGASACTDVTGFGLVGHLLEMLDASRTAAEFDLKAVPVMDGVDAVLREGIFSSLQPQNLSARRAIANPGAAEAAPRFPVLFDPQTAGGLLASVPAEAAEACVAELRRLGYHEAALIGAVLARERVSAPIRVVT
jgi:selenide,water dikinase